MTLAIYFDTLLSLINCGVIVIPLGLILGTVRQISVSALQRTLNKQRIQGYRIGSIVLISSLLVSIALLPIFYTVIIFPVQKTETERGGTDIIFAIEGFHERTGKYPEDLRQLVPVDIEQLPTMPSEYPFGYYLADGGWYQIQYKLFYLGIIIQECNYHSTYKQWECKQIQ